MSDKFNARKGLEIGRGLAEDATIEVKNTSANFPYVKYSETEQVWKFSNDGLVESEFGSGGGWGEITGTLSDQTDLQSALDDKLNSADNLSDVADQQTALNNITAVSGATDEYVLTKDTATGNAQWKEVVSSDELIKVSANDTTSGYLEDKIVASSGTNTANILEISTLNDGIDEDLQIQIDETKISHNNLTGVDALGSGVAYGHISDGAETIYGVKTFNSFPVTPSSEPMSDYEVANKSYVDSREFSYLISKGEIGEIKEWSWSVLPDGFLSLDGTTIAKEDYPDFFEFLILQGEITETDETYTLSTVADGIIRVEDDFNSIYEVVDSVPVGVINALATETIPEGWLECNGALLSREIFSELFEKIGITFGAGDGSTTFNLPDLRGEFIRGLDAGRGVDSGRTLGSWQNDSMQKIQGVINTNRSFGWANITPITSGAFSFTVGSTGASANTSTSANQPNRLEFDSSRVTRTSEETRSRNIALKYIIKYKIGDGRLS